ncbi:MAG: tetratricopeptide repeat protein [Pseudomonadota bacterium]|nr:tetratricopeptide repeat protein [Pseudomonadota bacterium]
MAVLENEQHQLEAIKEWWKEYGKITLFIFLLTLAASFGWRYWQQRQVIVTEHASLIYDQMTTSFANQNHDAFVAQANKLVSEFDKTPYANMAQFAIAHQAVKDGKFDKALTELQLIMGQSIDPQVRQIARVRAARVLLAQNKLNDALKTLETVDSEAFKPAVHEVRGDVYLAQGEAQKARESYKAAIAATPPDETNRPLLEMKFEQLSQHTDNLA